MKRHIVSMTPKTDGKIKTIIVERDGSVDSSRVFHKGTGHNAGIIINKESDIPDAPVAAQEMQLEFTCLMHNTRTEEAHAENRRLKFWFKDGTEHTQRLADSYDFFKDLINQESFPKDYVGFIKRMLKQLQSEHYPNIHRVELEIVPLKTSSQEAFVPEIEAKPIEIVVREGLLRTLEDAYPNVLSLDDLVRITSIDDIAMLTLQLEELQANDVIQSVSMDNSLIKRIGYRRKLHVLHKVEVIGGAEKMKSISHEQKPTIAIITNLLCEKMAVDALMDRKTTYVRYKMEGDSNVYTIGYMGSQKVISVKLPMVGRELQAKISSGSVTTRLLGTFQSIQHVVLVGVGGGVPYVYEFEKHSRLGDIVVSAPSAPQEIHLNGFVSPDKNIVSTTGPCYVYCEKILPISNGSAEVDEGAPIIFSHKNFAPRDPILLSCANSLLSAFLKSPAKCAWRQFIEEGLQNLNVDEFNFSRPPFESDKLKLQIGEDVTVDVKHPEIPSDHPWYSLDNTPLVRLGCIGSGRPVTDSYLLRELFANDQKLFAYDAEYDQVLESLLGNRLESFLIIRGIADYVEGRHVGEVAWQPYAALSAAAFTKALLIELQTVSENN